jgi:hypothetical protein
MMIEDKCGVFRLLVDPDLCKDPNYVKRIESTPLNSAYISFGEWGRIYKWEHE